MRIIVCMKQGVDPQSVKISRSREELDLREARLRTQPEDKYALEAGLGLKEAMGGEVIAVVVGGRGAEDAAREAVAMGADKGVLIVQKGQPGGKAVAALMQAAIERLGGADLMLAGRSGDLDTIGPLAGRLAAALDRPLIMDVLRFEDGPGGLTALSGCEGGAVRVPVALPAVALVMPGADRPRYPHPSRIGVVWNEGYVDVWPAAELGVPEEQLAADEEMGGLVLGPERQRGQMVSGSPAEAAAELAGILAGKRLTAGR
jgi:electron transfer flavoprotein beta subunit